MSRKIAIPATAPELDAPMESKFGRASLLLLIDADSHAFEAVTNPSRDAQGGAGIETAQLLSKHKVKGVIAEKYGPKAQQALSAAGIPLFLCQADVSVREALARYTRGELKEMGSEGRDGGGPSGSGGGRGRGGGGGRGMGGGGGLGMGGRGGGRNG